MKAHHIINDIDIANGGAQRIVQMLHRGLLEKGIESHVLTLTGKTFGLPKVESAGFARVRDFRAIFRIARYLKEACNDSDVVHVHLFPANLFVALAKPMSGWKGTLVCTEHSTNNHRRGTMLGRWIDLVLYKPYRRIACISAGTKDALFNWMPKLGDRLRVVENGAELAFSKCIERPVQEKVVVVSLGRLHPLKNYDTALRAIAQLDDLGFEYWLAGVGDDLPRLSALAEELGIEQKVRFLGFVEDIPKLLQEADVALIPSVWEGFGLVAVEAMNAGLPVVVSDVDGLREVVSSACALSVSPDRIDLFADALRKLIESPELRQKMGAEGFERSQQFSVEAMVEDYIKFYRDVLNG